MKKQIVVLHGLYMPPLIMQYIVRHLRKKGYSVHSFGYNSLNFEKASSKLNKFINSRFTKNDKVYFVGHSLGGLVIRDYFDKFTPKFKDSCIVTIGTPHSGAEVARFLDDKKASFILGKSANALINGLESKETSFDLGCIIGTYNIGVGSVISMENGDGTVSLSDAEYKHAKDSVYLKLNHTALVYSKTVVEQTSNFIETRKFEKEHL